MLIGPLLPQLPARLRHAQPERAGLRNAPGEDPQARLLAEAEREHDAILALIAQQRKRDDEFLRKVIELI